MIGETPSAKAAAFATAGEQAWSRAWGASDIAEIRRYLGEMKAAYGDSLKAANGSIDPNLSRLRSTAIVHIALADGALAMYDGAEVFERGRAQMAGGDYQGAADSFGSAASRLAASQILLENATSSLEAHGEPGTVAIIPLLKGKAAYAGGFSTWAQGWKQSALAYRARAGGEQDVAGYEAALASQIFAGLGGSPEFTVDAMQNFDIIAPVASRTAAPIVIEGLPQASSLALTVSGISPDWSYSGALGQVLEVSGGGFLPGAEVQLSKGTFNGEEISIDAIGEATVSLTEIRCTVNIPDCSGYRGEYNVYVRNPGGQVRCLPWGFRVGDVDNPITIQPRWAGAGETVTLHLHDDDGLFGDPQVRIVNLNGQAIEATGETGDDSDLECTLAVPVDAASNPVDPYTTYYLFTREPGEDSWRSRNIAFLVLDGLMVTGMDGYSQQRGTTVQRSVMGLGFDTGAQVRLRGPNNSYIDATGETVHPGRLTVDLAIPPTAAIGWYDVEVQNPGMTSWNRRNDAYLVVPHPQIAAVSPSSAVAGETVDLVITGLDFVSSVGFQAGLEGQGTIRAKDVIAASPGQITCTLEIPPDTPPGRWAAFVHVNTDMESGIGGTTTFAYDAFQVGPAYSKVTKVAPSQIPRNPSNPIVKLFIKGWNFKPGAQVWLWQDGYPLIEGVMEEIDSTGTAATCSINVLIVTPTGSYAVYVKNPGEEVFLPLPNGVYIL